jgi:hypothetical protein
MRRENSLIASVHERFRNQGESADQGQISFDTTWILAGRSVAELLYGVDACDETVFAANMTLPVGEQQPGTFLDFWPLGWAGSTSPRP